ncbi:cytochrome P450 [Ktedonosporobacter rubrisoli]|uniref:Cytochrome P450 n=1 Tax=Ktedonosporobacter rubrisoli TaxID=2509675 RepID=A0A4P6JIA9_KTERU|nr:cytochrome P450 [Ktedonosporobacter rubrisoli]QBD74797.1 cytochrome P450 [Ktedonosporobacter rubrisoli]
MYKQSTLHWENGLNDAPLPPLVSLQDAAHDEQLMVALYRAYGPVFRLAEAGKEASVILAGPEANVFMARHEDEFFSTKEQWQEFDAMISQNRGTTITEARDGDANRKRRSRSSREWSRKRILDQIPQMVEIIQACTSEWQLGSSIAVHASMRRLVSEQLGRLLVGSSPQGYLDDFVTFLNTTINSTLDTKERNSASTETAAYQRAVERVNEFSRKAYEEHLRHPQPNGKPDMLDDAIAQAEGYPAHMRQNMLELVALGPMLAGLDTVANSLSFMLYALLANPEALQRVQTEIDAVLSTGPLTWEKLQQMPALHGAMLETLRLYPVASGHAARVAHPFTIAGYGLEPGTEVRVAMTVPHFLEELYPHPLQFDIDRFHEPRNEHRKPGAFAPFGLGNHTCLGSGIAEVQMMVTMAVLLSDYAFRFEPEDYQLTIERHPSPAPGNNFSVKIAEQRNQQANLV